MDILADPLPPTAQDGGQPAVSPVQPCPQAVVTVTINLSAAVACPGHFLDVEAVGTPAGGTYVWTISGADALLMDANNCPTNAGQKLKFLSFRADDSNGSIPHQDAKLTVVYTCPEGSDSASKDLPVHGITFDVTGPRLFKGATDAIETQDALVLCDNDAYGGPDGKHPKPSATMGYPDLEVTIHLEGICPRQGACAGNHKVGWVQTITGNTRVARYELHTVSDVVPLPIRDHADGGGAPPFYGLTEIFSSNDNRKKIIHEDTPKMTAPWKLYGFGPDQKLGRFNQSLRRVDFANSFNTWLVVQNVEQYTRSPQASSLVYLRNTQWSIGMRVDVDMTKEVGSRCSPQCFSPTVGALTVGKGSATPKLDGPAPKDPGVMQHNDVLSPQI